MLRGRRRLQGATSGLGQESARILARCKAQLVLGLPARTQRSPPSLTVLTTACRNVEKAEKVAADLSKENPGANISVMQCDLSSFRSVRQFTQRFKVRVPCRK
jgi:short-subunit dehydrogenase